MTATNTPTAPNVPQVPHVENIKTKAELHAAVAQLHALGYQADRNPHAPYVYWIDGPYSGATRELFGGTTYHLHFHHPPGQNIRCHWCRHDICS